MSRSRFVVHRREAEKRRYELGLEIDGVLKCWSLARGPSVDPRDKRLAVQLPDRPLEFGDFEGRDGDGVALVWDRGAWVPEPAPGLAAGDFKFVLRGRHLRGSWVLVRIKGWSGRRDNWLLIKHRDAHAIEGDDGALLEGNRSVASGRTMAEVEAGRGRKPRPFLSRAAGAPGHTGRS